MLTFSAVFMCGCWPHAFLATACLVGFSVLPQEAPHIDGVASTPFLSISKTQALTMILPKTSQNHTQNQSFLATTWSIPNPGEDEDGEGLPFHENKKLLQAGVWRPKVGKIHGV